MPSSEFIAPAFGQIWEWHGGTPFMLLCPENEWGTVIVLWLFEAPVVAEMHGLGPDRILDGYRLLRDTTPEGEA